MKTCNACKVPKEDSEFYKQVQKSPDSSLSWDYLDSYCKACRKKAANHRKQQLKIKAVEYMGGKCADCGLIDDPCVYDFHHLDPSIKEFSFGGAGGKGFERIKVELAKCIMLCAICHRKRHKVDYTE